MENINMDSLNLNDIDMNNVIDKAGEMVSSTVKSIPLSTLVKFGGAMVIGGAIAVAADRILMPKIVEMYKPEDDRKILGRRKDKIIDVEAKEVEEKDEKKPKKKSSKDKDKK